MKNKKRIRFRRPLDMGAIFRSKKGNKKQEEERELLRMEQTIRKTFPDIRKRENYIEALIKGLEEEKICINS